MPVAQVHMRITIPSEVPLVARVPMRITIPIPIVEVVVAQVPMRITIPREIPVTAQVPMRITIPGIPEVPPPPPEEEGLKVPWLFIGGGAAVLGAILLLRPEREE